MKLSDLKRGTVYAWKIGYSSDIRHLENFVRVRYISPTVARYDKYRPDKKLNRGMILVELLQEYRLGSRWDEPKLLPVGTRHEIDAKDLLLSWDDLAERAGETHDAALQAEAYMQSLKDLIKEIAPKLTVDHERWNGSMDKADIMVNLRHGDQDTEFDPDDAQVSMHAETFRKLLQGVKV